MKWQRASVRSSILRVAADDKEHSQFAVSMHKSIRIYMGDSKKKLKSAALAAQDIIRKAISAAKTPVMLDEIYLLVCKQLLDNPNSISAVRGKMIFTFLIIETHEQKVS